MCLLLTSCVSITNKASKDTIKERVIHLGKLQNPNFNITVQEINENIPGFYEVWTEIDGTNYVLYTTQDGKYAMTQLTRIDNLIGEPNE